MIIETADHLRVRFVSNVKDDDAAIDQLYGETGSDWFFYTATGGNRDRLNDFVTGEVSTAQ